MKPKNNTEVRKAYLRFAGYLTCCTILAVSIFACFLKTLRHRSKANHGAGTGI
ncbi:hypothetical protein NXV46_02105 [Bacteroides thetaiotaomicron]|nr:hypothetical protein NXV46_02105 [Bacteroides thetaiotaomicron]